MKIEEELKVAGFETEYRKLQSEVLFTAGWIAMNQRRFYEKWEITPSQYNCLKIMKTVYPKTYSTAQIRERMIDRFSDTSRLVDRLILKGYLEKMTRKVDRRQIDVRITDKGSKLVDKIEAKMKDLEVNFHTLSQDEANQLSGLLEKLRG